MPALERVRERLLRFGSTRRAVGLVRTAELHRQYARRREHYHSRALAAGVHYEEAMVRQRTADRLARRGYAPAARSLGGVHTFAFIPRSGWHASLYPDLERLGPVTEFDYVAEGYDIVPFLRGDTAGRRRMNEAFVDRARSAHSRQKIDWVFIYATGAEVLAGSLRRLQDEIGVPIVTMCLDDKQSWSGRVIGGQRVGTVDLVPWVDLAWTSASVATEWYLVEGGNPIYMPEGFDQSVYRATSAERDIPVSFIGAAYGFRPSLMKFLKARGITVSVFGGGWKTRRVSVEEQVSIINRSQVNLGHGGIGYSEELTNVKGRDFEIPATGGGLYLTTFNPDLARHFVVGREIACYRSREEAVELIRYFLANPEEARAIAAAGRARCEREHRWLHRYQRVLETLGVLEHDSPAR